MFKKLKKTAALVVMYLGLGEIPIVEGKVSFDDDQNAKLNERFGEEMVEQMKNAFNAELATMNDAEELEKAKQEILTELEAAGFTDEEKEAIINIQSADDLDIAAQYKEAMKNFLDIKAKMKDQDALIQKLLKEPEAETAANLIKTAMKDGKIQHSATHLFGAKEDWNKFEDRPWNARFRDGGLKATDFNNESNIPLLQDDVEHFIRQNPEVINSLFDDFEDLPAEWSRKTGVKDRTADGFIIPAEIVQGRSKGWKPKNNFKFHAEEGKVYRKKIDISFDGYELQEIENTWVGAIKNMDGSHPWKMSFIGFLLSELVKQQKVDDRNAQINGIYVQTPEGDGNPGQAVNSQSGLLWLWWYYRDVTKQIRPFNMGVPTDSGIVDYIRTMIERIPEIERKQSGWEIQISEKLYRKYCEKAGLLYNLKFESDLGKQYYPLNYPIDYPSFKFQVLRDMTKTDFIGIVKSKNVQVLDYLTNEKGKFTVTNTKRNTDIFADYRLGIRFIMVGTETQPGDPQQFEKQVMYCNDVPVFNSKVTAPAYDDTTGILSLNFNSVSIDSGWKTDITNIKGMKDGPYMVDLKGKIVTITGNTGLTAPKAVKNNANLLLTGGDFPLQSGGTLTLYAQEDGKFKELSRTTEPAAPESENIPFDSATIDANDGNSFDFIGADDITLSNIINGVHGKVVTITKANDEESALTVSDNENIEVASNAVLDAEGDKLVLIYVNGKWFEVSRAIA